MPINSTCDKQTVQKLRLLLHQLFHTLPQILYIYDKFSRCSLTKRPWVRPTMVWRRRLPHCKRAPIAESWKIRKHFSRNWSFPPWRSCTCLLYEITRGKWHRQYFCGARNFWSWGCYFDYGRWKLYIWEAWNSIDIRSSSTPSVFWIYKNCWYIRVASTI